MSMDKRIEKKKWPPKQIIKYSLVAIFVIVKSGPFQEFIPIIGNVLPHNTIYLDAVEGGRVETIYIEAGSQVKKDDKILKLSNTNLLMTLLSNEAQINRASNELRATRLQLEQNRLALKQQRADADYYLTRIKRRFERNKVLFEEGMISKHEYEEFKDEYEYLIKKRELTIESQEKDLLFRDQQVKHLEASVKRMLSNLNLLKQQMENLTVRAPISGHLTSLMAEKGQSKRQGDRLGQIDDVAGFKVRAQIDEHYINRIEVGKLGEFDFAEDYLSKAVKLPDQRSGLL